MLFVFLTKRTSPLGNVVTAVFSDNKAKYTENTKTLWSKFRVTEHFCNSCTHSLLLFEEIQSLRVNIIFNFREKLVSLLKIFFNKLSHGGKY
jgi:hypothetical protein